MKTENRIRECSTGGVWYEPPGYHDYWKLAPRPNLEWFKTREAAEASLDARRMALRLRIADLKRELETI